VKPLTPTQKACFDAIKAYRERAGVMPTLEELRVAIAAASKSTVYRQLHELEQRGAIRRERWIPRGIVILGEKCPHCGKSLDGSQNTARAA